MHTSPDPPYKTLGLFCLWEDSPLLHRQQGRYYGKKLNGRMPRGWLFALLVLVAMSARSRSSLVQSSDDEEPPPHVAERSARAPTSAFTPTRIQQGLARMADLCSPQRMFESSASSSSLHAQEAKADEPADPWLGKVKYSKNKYIGAFVDPTEKGFKCCNANCMASVGNATVSNFRQHVVEHGASAQTRRAAIDEATTKYLESTLCDRAVRYIFGGDSMVSTHWIHPRANQSRAMPTVRMPTRRRPYWRGSCS